MDIIIILMQQSRLTQTRVVSCCFGRLHDPPNQALRFVLDIYLGHLGHFY
jgi:hypothetical protein